ncbi:MAG TPA: DUF2332 domain-containing protein [Streptosporangiaceae bacterium]
MTERDLAPASRDGSQPDPQPAGLAGEPAGELPEERTARLLREQGDACGSLGSPLYAGLLAHAADDLLAAGPTAGVLAGHLLDRGPSALALRMLGGVHALVLSGQAPELAEFYPSAGGQRDPGPGAGHAWQALRSVLAGQRDQVRGWLARPPQTNEVGRGAALIGGMRYLAARAALPIALVEIGASAGLNLRADRFCVAGESGSYGDPASPVVLRGGWQGQSPPAGHVQVISRTGGDTDPIDPVSADGALTLTAYVWPDQRDRLQRLRGALDLAAAIPVDLRREPASATLARTSLADGSWTVLWHSVMRQYLAPDQRAALASRVSELGAAATSTSRFGYLFLEPRRDRGFQVCLTAFPGDGAEQLLGTARPHGIPVTWGTP